MTGRVVVVPGLWMPALAMSFLAAQLARRGFAPQLFSYRGRAPLEDNVERLARFAVTRARGGALHYVGHSLGGLLILAALERHPELPAASAVLIGSPVNGCAAGRSFGRAALGRWMMGASRPLWEPCSARWTRQAPLGVIAGTAPFGLGRVLGPLAGENDGVVSLSETDVEGMKARAIVRLGHSSLIFSPRVAALAARFLSTGAFE